uniref:Putative secreted protein n=1 Tax=Ixodes ricinus TaxID=34613 RepID=A0A090X9B3_IXORI
MVAFKVSVAVLLRMGSAFAIPSRREGPRYRRPDPGRRFPPARKSTGERCPQLQPSENERQQKALVIDQIAWTRCPFPDVDTANDTVIQQHRQDVTTCALQRPRDGSNSKRPSTDFDRARTEILNKKLAKDVRAPGPGQAQRVAKKEAEEKFAKNFVAQVQLYQACYWYLPTILP